MSESKEKARELLRLARAYIEQPERWTIGAIARNADGDLVGALDEEVMCWCVLNTIEFASATTPGLGSIQIQDAARDQLKKARGAQIREIPSIGN